jgi:hypothetical protein
MRTTSIITSVLVALAAAPAWADLPPPSTYVEACTIAKQQTATSECLQCSAYYGSMNRCATLLGPYCYQSLCKTWGASSWSEVLCRTKGANAPVVPSDVIAILGSATTAAPDGVDGGTIPASCAPYLLSTATETKSGTATQSSTESKTSTSSATTSYTDTSIIATATATETAVVTQSATSTQSNTQNATLVHTSTDTSTGSSASKAPDDSSGCSVTAGKSAVRALGPLSVLLAGLALLVLKRRSRR